MTRLAIVGFGLIGGSLALAARATGAATRVTAIDRADVIGTPEARNAADALVDASDDRAVRRAFAASDLTVLAMPVRVICEELERALAEAPIVTDCGSTKREIQRSARASARAARFVPGHPMAGLPGSGVGRARADLFQGKNWLLCPEGADADALAAVEALVAATGARVVHLSAEIHDAAVARTSHLPQLLASALAVLGGEHAALGTAGPAFERMTHGAGGAAPIWHDIFASNGDEVAGALRELLALIAPIAEELEGTRDRSSALAEALLARARRLKIQGF